MPARSLYFVNGWFDALVIGGLSILAWIGFALLPQAEAMPLAGVAFALSFVVNYPHFSATVYRLYQDPANVRAFPVTAIGLPLLLIGAVGAGLWQPRLVAPYVLLLYVLWSPYHYSGQTIGLTMVYARRAGFRIGPRQRLALSCFVFSAFVCGVIRMQQGAAHGGIIQVNDLSVPALTLPLWLYVGATAAMAAGALAFAGFVLAWCIAQKRLLPPIVLLPALAHFVWFVPGAGLKAFWLMIPAFHSLQYLLIALVMQLQRRSGAAAIIERGRLAAEAVRWGVSNVLGGVALFVGLPAVLIALHFPPVTAFALVVAAVNIHHFFVDGVIWKLRDPATSAALMTSLAELGAPALPAPARAAT